VEGWEGSLCGTAPATILTDGAAHRASQTGPTQLTHLSWWRRETGGTSPQESGTSANRKARDRNLCFWLRRWQEPLLLATQVAGTSAAHKAGDRNLC
jgi:hypothetical protein